MSRTTLRQTQRLRTPTHIHAEFLAKAFSLMWKNHHHIQIYMTPDLFKIDIRSPEVSVFASLYTMTKERALKHIQFDTHQGDLSA